MRVAVALAVLAFGGYLAWQRQQSSRQQTGPADANEVERLRRRREAPPADVPQAKQRRRSTARESRRQPAAPASPWRPAGRR